MKRKLVLLEKKDIVKQKAVMLFLADITIQVFATNALGQKKKQKENP